MVGRDYIILSFSPCSLDGVIWRQRTFHSNQVFSFVCLNKKNSFFIKLKTSNSMAGCAPFKIFFPTNPLSRYKYNSSLKVGEWTIYACTSAFLPTMMQNRNRDLTILILPTNIGRWLGRLFSAWIRGFRLIPPLQGSVAHTSRTWYAA